MLSKSMEFGDGTNSTVQTRMRRGRLCISSEGGGGGGERWAILTVRTKYALAVRRYEEASSFRPAPVMFLPISCNFPLFTALPNPRELRKRPERAKRCEHLNQSVDFLMVKPSYGPPKWIDVGMIHASGPASSERPLIGMMLKIKQGRPHAGEKGRERKETSVKRVTLQGNFEG